MSDLIEIERKFLPSTDFNIEEIKRLSQKKHSIKQGYICDEPERTVRVRTKNNQGYLTIKGKSTAKNSTRFEWEKEIDLSDAEQLLHLCQNETIIKTRFEILFEGNIFEVDVFENENDGLVIIEIELNAVDQIFKKPNWLGQEVTEDARYFNSFISKNPFCKW